MKLVLSCSNVANITELTTPTYIVGDKPKGGLICFGARVHTFFLEPEISAMQHGQNT